MPYLSPSTLRRFAVGLLFGAALMGRASAAERNVWPFWVGAEDERSGEITAAQALGPLLVEKHSADGAAQQIWRPIFLRETRPDRESAFVLYPLLSWERRGDSSSFSFFQIVNHQRTTSDPGAARAGFDIWPLYFSRTTGDPATSYRALLPITGTIKQRFGKDALTWHAFPLYFHVEQAGRHTRYTPWPFVRTTTGAGHRGFELWPLAGQRSRAGDYRDGFLLWPLLYRSERNLAAAQPDVRFGFLPFYARATGPGYRDETYLWPFFGYTDRTTPQAYRETRYLWPLLVQGRGDQRHINRWAPLYTHSIVKGTDKTWLLWPLYRRAIWQNGDLAHERQQLLFFLFWTEEQRSLTRSTAAPAHKTHLWPLFSSWDNGAGQRQLQALSPLEVFFPHNPVVRQVYSPLFAFFRYDERAPDHVRWSLLWNAVSSKRTPTEREFHLGPLLGTHTRDGAAHVTVGAGLLSWRRAAPAARWRFSFFDFRRSFAPAGQPAASP